MTGQDDPRPLILWTIAVSAIAAAILWALYLARNVLLLVYIGLLLAIGFSPLVRLIQDHRLPATAQRVPRWLAILVLYLFIIAAIVAMGLVVIPPLMVQAQAFWQEIPDMLDRFQQALIAWGVLRAPITLRDAVERAPGASTAVPVALAMLGFLGGLFGILTVLILTFYFLVEGEALFAGLLRLLPRSSRERAARLSREITVKVSAWLVGQLLLAVFIGSSALLFLWLLGVPYFYVLALIAGIGEVIPIVGPILAAIPGVAVGFSVSVQTGLIVGVFYIVQQQLENHLLVPKLMGRQVGIRATTVIIALLVGGSLLGIVGAILAVPTAAIVQIVFEELTGGADDAS